MIDARVLALFTAVTFGLAPVLIKMAYQRGGTTGTGLQYADFTAWQSEVRESDGAAAGRRTLRPRASSKQHWSQTSGACLPLLEMFPKHAGARYAGFNGRLQGFQI